MTNDPQSPEVIAGRAGSSARAKQLGVGLLVALLIAGAVLFRDHLSLDRLAEREREFRELQQQHTVLVYLMAFTIYVVVTGLSLPGAAALTLAIAWLLGFWPALPLVSCASTLGACLAFLLSRYLLRDALLSRFRQPLENFNAALQRDGAYYLFSLRLIPAVPFFLINLVMGLTPLRLRTFWWVSQLGMLPGTIVYVFAGSALPDLQSVAQHGVRGILTWPIILAFTLLGLFPLVVRQIANVVQRSQTDSTGRTPRSS